MRTPENTHQVYDRHERAEKKERSCTTKTSFLQRSHFSPFTREFLPLFRSNSCCERGHSFYTKREAMKRRIKKWTRKRKSKGGGINTHRTHGEKFEHLSSGSSVIFLKYKPFPSSAFYPRRDLDSRIRNHFSWGRELNFAPHHLHQQRARKWKKHLTMWYFRMEKGTRVIFISDDSVRRVDVCENPVS